MIFSTFYFSGTGNTEWAVKEFTKLIEMKGHQSVIYSIDGQNMQDKSTLKDILMNSDYIGFANPIYGANIPPIMNGFINKIKNILLYKKNFVKSVYIINTFGYVNAFGPFAAKKLFSNTGLKLVSYANLKICNNISTPKIKSKPIDSVKLEKRKVRSKIILEKMINKILQNKRYITGIGPYLIPGLVIRKISKKGIADSYLALGINLKTCNRCMMCVNKCPTQSIKFYNQKFEFLQTCTACMRCYNFCPTFSILFEGKYADPKEFYRYRGPDTYK